MSGRAMAGLALAGVLIIGGGIGGYLVGAAGAPSSGEGDRAYDLAHAEAMQAARANAVVASRERGEEEGLAKGASDGERYGEQSGSQAGDEDSAAELAAVEAQEPAPAPAAPNIPPGSTYTDQLPHGRPGYVLPEEQRSLACVGVDAVTGECIGD